MLNSIKTLKRYCIAILSVFFNKNHFLMMTKKFYVHDKFFVSNRNFNA